MNYAAMARDLRAARLQLLRTAADAGNRYAWVRLQVDTIEQATAALALITGFSRLMAEVNRRTTEQLGKLSGALSFAQGGHVCQHTGEEYIIPPRAKLRTWADLQRDIYGDEAP